MEERLVLVTGQDVNSNGANCAVSMLASWVSPLSKSRDVLPVAKWYEKLLLETAPNKVRGLLEWRGYGVVSFWHIVHHKWGATHGSMDGWHVAAQVDSNCAVNTARSNCAAASGNGVWPVCILFCNVLLLVDDVVFKRIGMRVMGPVLACACSLKYSLSFLQCTVRNSTHQSLLSAGSVEACLTFSVLLAYLIWGIFDMRYIWTSSGTEKPLWSLTLVT